MLCIYFKVSDDDSSSKRSIIQPETNAVLFSPNTQIWKVDALNEKQQTEFELNNKNLFNSPGRKWNISSVDNETNERVQLANVTRTLVLEESSKILNKGEYYYT